MRTRTIIEARTRCDALAFTLVEVVISIAVVASVFAGIVMAYIQAANRAEWSGYSLAAQALAVQQVEQVRSAVWDLYLPKDDSTNITLNSWSYSSGVLTGYTWTNLDLPYSGTNYVRATNYVTVSVIQGSWNGLNNTAKLRMIRVDTVWPFIMWGHSRELCTNTICSYCAPDN